MAATEACTCALGHPDHEDGCACTTTIMDCAVHGGSDPGRTERDIAERWYRERLEYLRGELRAERISYGELSELQGLAGYIEPGDTELLEAAGVPEFHEKEE